jgi:3-oxoacyl-[acyl-carrier protein] reductase
MAPRRLQDQVALVTGGSRGIGAAIAQRLAREGATIIITYGHDAEAAERMCDEIDLLGAKCEAIRCDMEIPSQIESLFAAIAKSHQRLDILVNNAAVAERVPLEAIDVAQFARFFNVNVRGPILAIQQALPLFGPDGGRIINISSAIVREPGAQMTLYTATKAALDAVTACLARELGPRRITVFSVAPGLIDTQLARGTLPETVFTKVKASTPLGRLGMPADIANIVAYLVTEDANWLTGEILGATGGR